MARDGDRGRTGLGHGGGGGAVAAGHPASARAAADVLVRGGNAADALVAGVIASWAAEPTVSGPCGGGFALVRDGASGAVTLLDAFVAAPGSAGGAPPPMDAFDVHFGTTDQRFWIGLGSCAVPGTAAGVGEVHRRFGSLPWSELVAPGAALARHGVEITPQHALLQELLAGILTAMPAGRSVFAPDGRLLGAGELVQQPALARTLDRLAETGVDDLYRGRLAAEIDAFSRDLGGLLAAADLAAYRVLERPPVRVTYRGHAVTTNAPPSSGGALMAHALAIADRLPPGSGPLGAVRATLLAAALAEADARRTPALAAALAAARDGDLLDPDAIAAAAARVADRLAGDRPGPRPSPLPAGQGTTHISVVDARGSMAAMTTSTGCGSGVFVADTGLHLNNMLGEEDLRAEGTPPPAAGVRLTSMMAPTLVSGPDGFEAAIGTSGSARIRSALVRVVTSLVDDRAAAQTAIDLPRIHPGPSGLDVEPGFADDALVALRRLVDRVIEWPARDIYFGGAQVAERRDGALRAGGDPRRGGAGLVVEP